jgi:hypothetical protein
MPPLLKNLENALKARGRQGGKQYEQRQERSVAHGVRRISGKRKGDAFAYTGSYTKCPNKFMECAASVRRRRKIIGKTVDKIRNYV